MALSSRLEFATTLGGLALILLVQAYLLVLH